MVLRGWPNPIAWRKTKAKPWHHTRRYADEVFSEVLVRLDILPRGPTLYPDLLLDDDSVWQPGEMPLEVYIQTIVEPKQRIIARKFAASTPPEVFKTVAAYTDRRWHLYCMFARCPGTLELATTQPSLAFAMASCWAFHRPTPTQPMRAVRAISKKSIPAMWAWLGFPDNDSSIQLHQELQPTGLSVNRLLNYRSAMNVPATQAFLIDIGPLEWDILDLAITPWLSRVVTRSLLVNLAKLKNWDLNWPQVIKDAMWELRFLDKSYVLPNIPRCKTVKQVLDFKNHCAYLLKSRQLIARPE